jgi:hypothetical protein
MPTNRCVFPRFGFGLSRSVHSANYRLDSGVWWSSHVTFIVIYRRKDGSKSSTRCLFWSIVSTRGSHFAHSFCMSKYSCTIWSTRFYDIFRVSTISINFILRSFKIIFLTFFMFLSETASVGRPLRCTFRLVFI